ncbi:MAG: C-GCAxxG-C-C family protein [Bacteroidaceae bacterium]|nr:C-GCAxxG-C-C family protein [Bacteroidaceae bacterium]
MTVEEREKRAKELFKQGYNCCQAVTMTFSDVLGIEPEMIARLASGFGGGMGRMREVCGTVSGMTMVAGALKPYDNVSDKAAKTACYALVQNFAAEFKKKNGSIICRELLGLDKPEGTPVPQDRTTEYYRKRPCAELCAMAAGIVARHMKSEQSK